MRTVNPAELHAAIGSAIQKSLETGEGYVVIAFLGGRGDCYSVSEDMIAGLGAHTALAPHVALTPAYRASINASGELTVINHGSI